MFPNDLWQTHFLTRPALGKILIIPRGEGEKPPDVQLDNLAAAMAAALLGCARWCPCHHVPQRAIHASLHAQWSPRQ